MGQRIPTIGFGHTDPYCIPTLGYRCVGASLLTERFTLMGTSEKRLTVFGTSGERFTVDGTSEKRITLRSTQP